MHTRLLAEDIPGVFRARPDLHASVVINRAPVQYEITGQLPYRPDASQDETMAGQAEAVMQNIQVTLDVLELSVADVVRINIYTSDMDAFLAEALDIVFGFFGDHKPVSTLVGVARLPNPATKLSIEVSAAK